MEPDVEVGALVRTRLACHGVAEHVLATALHAATGRIGLTFAGIGIATPEFDNAKLRDGESGDRERIAFDGHRLLVERVDERFDVPVPTIAAAARALGITPGAPADVYPPSTPLEPDAPLHIDDAALDVLWTWFRIGEEGLTTMRAEAAAADAASPLVLWPEHFDLAFELGDEATGSRGTFGASPGDAAHELPYLYVTHWSNEPGDRRWRHPFWNAATFTGSILSMTTVAAAPDPVARTVEFYRTGRELMRGPRID